MIAYEKAGRYAPLASMKQRRMTDKQGRVVHAELKLSGKLVMVARSRAGRGVCTTPLTLKAIDGCL